MGKEEAGFEDRRRNVFDRRFFERRMWKVDFRSELKQRVVGDTRIMDRRTGDERRSD